MTLHLISEDKFAAMDFAKLASCVGMAGGEVVSCERRPDGYLITTKGVDLQGVRDCGRYLTVTELLEITP
jgi:hypothetical protein